MKRQRVTIALFFLALARLADADVGQPVAYVPGADSDSQTDVFLEDTPVLPPRSVSREKVYDAPIRPAGGQANASATGGNTAGGGVAGIASGGASGLSGGGANGTSSGVVGNTVDQNGHRPDSKADPKR